MKRQYVFDGPETIIPKDKAQRFGEALETLAKEKGGTFKPKDVVELARRKTSPLHDYFDWEDPSAAEKWRVEQAKALLRHIKVRIERDGQERLERAFVCVDIVEGDHAPKKVFVKLEDAVSGAHASSKKVTEIYADWLELQVRSYLKQNARVVEYNGTRYVLTEVQAVELARIILLAAGVPVLDRASIKSFAGAGPEAN